MMKFVQAGKSKLLRFLSLAGVFFTMIMAASCAPNNVETLAALNPKLSLEEFFEGETVAYGIFEDRFGSLKRQFRVNITGTIDGNRLILDEKFLYQDGEKASRIWTITNLGAGDDGLTRYEGSAADIDGKASGTVAGNALNWSYDIDLVTDDGTLAVHFDDWIYQQDEHVAINRAYVSKFGIDIGSVTLVFLRGKAAASVGPLNLEEWS